jgi:hypothetical protein
MDISAIIRAIASLPSEQDQRSLSSLVPGEKLSGRVLHRQADGRVLMDLKGIRVHAQVGFVVEEGQILRLKVVESGPQVHLKVVDTSAGQSGPLLRGGFAGLLSPEQSRQWGAIAARIGARTAAADPQHSAIDRFISALGRISSAMAPLSLDRPSGLVAAQLRQIIQDNGVLFEKKLADIATAAGFDHGRGQRTAAAAERLPVLISQDVKPQLLLLKSILSSSASDLKTALGIDSKAAVFLHRAADRMLGHIERQQEQIAARAQPNEPLLLFGHMVSMQDQGAPVQLKVYYPKKGRPEGQPNRHRIALLLQMDRLGMVRADIAALDGTLHVHFFVQDEATAQRFRQNIETVRRPLGADFDEVVVKVLVSIDKIAEFHEEDRNDETPGRIDLKA